MRWPRLWKDRSWEDRAWYGLLLWNLVALIYLIFRTPFADAAWVSRSSLTRAFRHCLQRSVHDEIRRKRLAHCTKLLCKSGMTIADIAAASGFPAEAYLYQAFKKEFGMTPREYRVQR